MDNLELIDFFQRFPNEQACLDYLEAIRWPNDRACPHCGSLKNYKFKSGKLFKCGDCKKQFTAKVGTIFTDSHIPLQKWFLAVYLLTSQKKGISSIALAKHLKITQKSAWFMLQRIRYAMSYGTFEKPLDGTVEADETYIGGKATSKERFNSKVAVIGVVEKRKDTGRIVTRAVKHANATNTLPFVRQHTAKGATVHTDESSIYFRLGGGGYNHEVVTHKNHEYVRNGVSTNTIDGAWLHLKLGLKAIYMGVSPKHLGKYCDEFAFRYNTRDLKNGERFEQWFKRVNHKHLPYSQLIG